LAAKLRTLPRKSWVNDPHVWWRHPVARLVLDMILFFEDPTNDSEVEANIPGVGHVFNFIFDWSAGAGAAVLKVFLLPVAVLSGCWFGRQVLHHRLLRDRLKLHMFADHKGTFALMGMCTLVFLLIAALIFDAIIGNDAGGAVGMSMHSFSQLTQCLSVSLDILAIMMIMDEVLQDRTHYGNWLPELKAVWIEGWGGWLRVVVVWVVTLALLLFTYVSILGFDVGDDYNRLRIGGFSEVGRAGVVSCVIFCDLCTVAQDWEFPSFGKTVQIDGRRILVAGTRVPEVRLDLLARLAAKLPEPPTWLRRFYIPPEFWVFSVTGAWLTYGPLLGVVLVDLVCAKNQLFYEPSAYGQYARGDDLPGGRRLWSILDADYLGVAYTNGVLKVPDMVTYAARWNATTGDFSGSGKVDFETRSLYLASPWRYICVAPGLLLIPLFGFFVISANQSKQRYIEESHSFDSFAEQLSKDQHTDGEVAKALDDAAAQVAEAESPDAQGAEARNTLRGLREAVLLGRAAAAERAGAALGALWQKVAAAVCGAPELRFGDEVGRGTAVVPGARPEEAQGSGRAAV